MPQPLTELQQRVLVVLVSTDRAKPHTVIASMLLEVFGARYVYRDIVDALYALERLKYVHKHRLTGKSRTRLYKITYRGRELIGVVS